MLIAPVRLADQERRHHQRVWSGPVDWGRATDLAERQRIGLLLARHILKRPAAATVTELSP